MVTRRTNKDLMSRRRRGRCSRMLLVATVALTVGLIPVPGSPLNPRRSRTARTSRARSGQSGRRRARTPVRTVKSSWASSASRRSSSRSPTSPGTRRCASASTCTSSARWTAARPFRRAASRTVPTSHAGARWSSPQDDDVLEREGFGRLQAGLSQRPPGRPECGRHGSQCDELARLPSEQRRSGALLR